MWQRFVRALDDPVLSDPRFVTREGRFEHRDEVIARVQEVLLGDTSRGWEARLGEVGVACGAVNDVGAALTESQTVARGLVLENEHPAYGTYEHVRGPLPTQARATVGPAPLLGEHTDDALRDLGYSGDRIASLRAAGIVS
jgi:crotonobetainyl-CoA:carnitine CoA-transferase CaiB-like acyl-CoA transferase